MRINNRLRDRIADALIKHAFDERQKAMFERESALALEVYRIKMPEAFERKCDKLEEEGADYAGDHTFFDRISAVNARPIDGSDTKLHLAHRRVWTGTYTPSIKLDDHKELSDKVDAFDVDQSALNVEISKARSQIDATLQKCHTAKQLRATWPEAMSIAEPILKDAGMEPKAQPLVVATEDLNATLGLPVDNDNAKELEAA